MGTVLVVLTILAIANWWFEPFEGKVESAASLASGTPDPMVRRTPGWTPAGRATITPGTQTLTGASQAAMALQDRSSARGWSHTISSGSPGLPGDSGSGYVDEDGRAIGTLSTLAFGTLLVWNGLSDLSRELVYARRHSGINGLSLELGTISFRGQRAEAWSELQPGHGR